MPYSGEYRDRLRHGNGTYSFDGETFKYSGEWFKGKMHGKGTFMIAKDDYYEGEFRDGEIDGVGLRKWPDGSSYSGQFRQGERDGEGVFISAKGERYEGQWRSNQRWGYGEVLYTNKDTYKGPFVANHPHGEGVRTFSFSNSRYEGEWHCGVRHGQGRLVEVSSGRILYQGQWRNDQRNGLGLGLVSDDGITYEGEWQDDNPVYCAEKMMLKVVAQGGQNVVGNGTGDPATSPTTAPVAPGVTGTAFGALHEETLLFPTYESITVKVHEKHKLPGIVAQSVVVRKSASGKTAIVQTNESNRRLRLRLYRGSASKWKPNLSEEVFGAEVRQPTPVSTQRAQTPLDSQRAPTPSTTRRDSARQLTQATTTSGDSAVVSVDADGAPIRWYFVPARDDAPRSPVGTPADPSGSGDSRSIDLTGDEKDAKSQELVRKMEEEEFKSRIGEHVVVNQHGQAHFDRLAMPFRSPPGEYFVVCQDISQSKQPFATVFLTIMLVNE